ncbi:MAG: hypothetical protein JW702_07475 [Clostridiales bacterium]|nr:hypothetical protein [Clostridiales bacterium]
MKVIAKPIHMIACFNEDGKIRPLKFKVEDSGINVVIKIDQVIKTTVEKYAGNIMHVFDCRSEIEGEIKLYQLKYEIETNRWILFKM